MRQILRNAAFIGGVMLCSTTLYSLLPGSGHIIQAQYVGLIAGLVAAVRAKKLL